MTKAKSKIEFNGPPDKKEIVAFNKKLVKRENKKTQLAIIGISVIDSLNKKASPLVKKLSGITISTKEEFEQAAKRMAELKQYGKEAEEKQASIIDPINQSIKATRAVFKPFITIVSETEMETKNAMVQFLEHQEKAAKKIESKFSSGEIKKVSTVTTRTSELRNTTSEFASAKKIWRLKILDAKKIPREFLVPDENAIKEAFKRGDKVAGCVWEKDTIVAI